MSGCTMVSISLASRCTIRIWTTSSDASARPRDNQHQGRSIIMDRYHIHRGADLLRTPCGCLSPNASWRSSRLVSAGSGFADVAAWWLPFCSAGFAQHAFPASLLIQGVKEAMPMSPGGSFISRASHEPVGRLSIRDGGRQAVKSRTCYSNASRIRSMASSTFSKSLNALMRT
jgi:hypothetical protein